MNSFDILVIVVLCVTIFLGLWKGLVRQLFGLGGVIVGYGAAVSLYDVVGALFPFERGTADVVGFISVFICSLLLAMLLSFTVGKLIDAVHLSWLNRLGGAVLGFVKGGALVAIVSLVMIAFLPADNQLLVSSRSLPFVLRSIDTFKGVIPREMQTRYLAKLQTIKGVFPLNGVAGQTAAEAGLRKSL